MPEIIKLKKNTNFLFLLSIKKLIFKMRNVMSNNACNLHHPLGTKRLKYNMRCQSRILRVYDQNEKQAV